MRFVDAFRAQYFLSKLEQEIQELASKFAQSTLFVSTFRRSISPFLEALAIELDQILLPIVAFELATAKSSELLKGSTKKEKYESFFIQEAQFTRRAKQLPEKYPFLFYLIDCIIESSFSNLSKCLMQLQNDFLLIANQHFVKPSEKLKNISIISSSDRHRNKQTLLLSFSENSRVIYKPTDLRPDLLFSTFVENLDFPKPYDLKCMRTLPFNEYGWIEVITCEPCEQEKEIEEFFLRAGVLLAIADALNYTDGHCENLIAHKNYPVLLDGETFFQNYSIPLLKQKNILSTLLIQKAPNQLSQKIPYSAFQSPAVERLEILYAYPLNDRTDDLEVRFRGISSKKNQNCPFYQNKHFVANQYAQQVIQGYSKAYDHISVRAQDILQQKNWWDSASQVHSRIVIRETAAYAYLLRRIQQPDNCISKKHAIEFIEKKLGKSPYFDYEKQDILQGNIPYFYHIPGKKHFYDGKNLCYENCFEQSAMDSLKEQFANRSEAKRDTDCAIIAKQLSRNIE